MLGGLWRRPRLLAPPLLLLALSVTASLFTVSDLFVTHYAAPAAAAGRVGLGLATLVTPLPNTDASDAARRMQRPPRRWATAAAVPPESAHSSCGWRWT
ncbi:MAG: hypothetical protein R3A10_16005 [Caldilineaceae bacterium]